ncbi:FtsK/SpoIIIE domain-containing protein [Luteococcus sp.]|uniref:FtsK/SpoIIIE domain-containing protein n=1 Tax=Luteococcus sp. TaxID=1969402 RepID=UPI00373685C8
MAKPTYTVEQLTVAPRPSVAWRQVLVAGLALTALLGCLVWMGASDDYAFWAGFVLAVAGGQALVGYRNEERNQRAAQAHTAMQINLGFPVRILVTWSGRWIGEPRQIVLDYPPSERSDTIASQVTTAANGAWAPVNFTTSRGSSALAGKLPDKLGKTASGMSSALRKLRKSPPNRIVLWRSDGEEVEGQAKTPLERLQERIVDVAKQTFGEDCTVKDFKTDGDQVLDFVIQHRAGPKLVDDRVQVKVSEALSQMIPGRWRSTFDLITDTVSVHWRRPLPKMVIRPLDPGEHTDTMIPIGINEDGVVVYWDFAGQFAHFLLAGRTRTGKTVSLTGTLIECCRLGHRVYAIDPKRTEFLALRGWPNVQMVASKVEDQLALLLYLRDLMMERYRLIEEEGADEDDFEHVVVLIDEYKQFTSNVASWWRQHKVTGMPAQCPALDVVGDLLRMAAAARIHIVLGTQRPDADTVGGEVRDNFSARGSTGGLSPDGAKMMYDSEHIGVAIPKIQGRGTFAGTDGRPEQIQYFFTPNPRKAKKPEHIELLEALRPAHTSWERQVWEYPDEETTTEWLNENKSAKAGREWARVLNAELVPWTADASVMVEAELIVDSDDDADGYGPEVTVCPSSLVVGDLMLMDDGEAEGEWVTVTEVRPEGRDTVWVGWLGESDDGLIATNDDCPVFARHQVDQG